MLSSQDLLGVFLMSLCLGSARTKKRKYLTVLFVQIILVWTSSMCDFFILSQYICNTCLKDPMYNPSVRLIKSFLSKGILSMLSKCL